MNYKKKKEDISEQLNYKKIELNKIKNELKKIENENNKMKIKNKELIKNTQIILQKNQYIDKKFHEKEEHEKNIKIIQNNFNNQIQLILENNKKIIYEIIKENLDKIFKNFETVLNNLKKEGEKRNNNCLKMENYFKSTKNEINELFSSTQISHKVYCNECNKEIKGIKYECSECKYNLCENCELINFLKKKHLHKFYIIRKPVMKYSIKNE